METIYGEILEVAEGKVAVEDSVLRNAPHTVDVVSADEWDRPYSRTQAAFPVPSLRANKYFTPVGRIDGAGGDRSFDDSMNFCVSRVFRLFVRRRGSGAPGRLTVHT